MREREELTGDDYKTLIENESDVFRKMNTFKSSLHNIHTEMRNKVVLCHHDDRRFIIPNTSRTLPWGHNDITFYQTDPALNIQLATNVLDESISDFEIINEIALQRSTLSQEINDRFINIFNDK